MFISSADASAADTAGSAMVPISAVVRSPTNCDSNQLPPLWSAVAVAPDATRSAMAATPHRSSGPGGRGASVEAARLEPAVGPSAGQGHGDSEWEPLHLNQPIGAPVDQHHLALVHHKRLSLRPWCNHVSVVAATSPSAGPLRPSPHGPSDRAPAPWPWVCDRWEHRAGCAVSWRPGWPEHCQANPGG